MRWYRQTELRTLPIPKFLVPPYLVERTLAQMSGPSGVGKTFVYTDWCCRLAADGKRALVILGEGLYRYQSRLDAWQAHHGLVVPNDNLVVLADVPALPDANQMAELIAEVRAVGHLDLIVVDTFARAMAGYDEKDAADVTAALRNLAEFRRAADDATGMLVTHFGWEGTRQRGSSALYGECDTVVYVKAVGRKQPKPAEEELDSLGYLMEDEGPKSRRCRVVLEKQRDAPDDVPGLTLERVAVEGTGSCVYLPVKKSEVKVETNGHGEVDFDALA